MKEYGKPETVTQLVHPRYMNHIYLIFITVILMISGNMSFHCASLCSTVMAYRTRIWLLACVNTNMRLQMPLLGESCRAVRTHEWPFSSVNPSVIYQVDLFWCGVLTVTTVMDRTAATSSILGLSSCPNLNLWGISTLNS